MLLICLGNYANHGQESISTTTSTEKLEKVNYQYLDINEYEQKWLFRINSNVANSFIFPATIRIERKLSAAISLDVGLREDIQLRSHDRIQGETFEAGLKIYPIKLNMKGGQNDQVDNFTGTYWRTSFGVTNIGFGSNYDYTLSYGHQEKIGKWGVIDAFAFASFRSNVFSKSFTLGINTIGGFGYGPIGKQSIKGKIF